MGQMFIYRHYCGVTNEYILKPNNQLDTNNK